MAQISMAQVKELRERTQAGLNDCKSALEEAGGDIEKAVEIILKKGLAKSAQRAGKVASEGVVAARLAADGKSGVLVEVNIQTDFAARNPEFLGFVDEVLAAAEAAPDGVELGTGKLEATRQALVGKLGENITIRRWRRVAVTGPGLVQSYVHMGGKVGVLVAVGTAEAAAAARPEVAEFAENVAMQAAAMAPLFLDLGEVPEAIKAKQAEIFDAQLAEEGKPEKVRPKIIEGKIQKWLKEACLREQQSVIDTDKTVDQLRAELSRTIGSAVELAAFARFERGEGIEKPQGPDFADEVAKMAGGG
ncbi:MAG: translation elongation factor Ts [Polyangiaceae bacterium]|nr:translation elongation factor Ts [Polyangiaceae bacterium]